MYEILEGVNIVTKYVLNSNFLVVHFKELYTIQHKNLYSNFVGIVGFFIELQARYSKIL
jgi:hypothetical protein